MLVRSALINVMMKAAFNASKGLMRDFKEVETLQISRKGPADFVSEADRRAENAIFKSLQKARPDFGFLMEESTEIKSSDEDQARFIVDPLDGTTNYLHGLPHFAISIGCEIKGEVVAATVYDPIKEEHFWAEKGKGAYLGSKLIKVAQRRHLSDTIFATGIPFKGHLQENDGHEAYLETLKRVMEKTAGVRRFGAASLDLCYVACGRFDGFWEKGLKPWDSAAGGLIAKEAGALISTMDRKKWSCFAPSLVAANIDLHPHLLNLLIGE